MFCKTCGTQIAGESHFCQSCGGAAESTIMPGNRPYSVAATSSNFGVIAFVLSIVGLIVAGIILGVLSVILGAIGMSKQNEKHRGLAIAAIVIGIIDFVAAIIILAVMGSMLPF